jgi:hypothetical protein
MEYSKAFDEKQNKLLDDQSRGPGLYQLDESLRTNKPAYAWSPGTNVSREDKAPTGNLTDVQSDLRNLGRPLTKNIFGEYSPYDSKTFNEPIHGDDGFFEQVNSRLSDPAFDLKEYGVNRWEWLPIDPQKNAVEPFRRIGDNSVLQVLDNHKTSC